MEKILREGNFQNIINLYEDIINQEIIFAVKELKKVKNESELKQ